jgi:hypothetical protein
VPKELVVASRSQLLTHPFLNEDGKVVTVMNESDEIKTLYWNKSD